MLRKLLMTVAVSAMLFGCNLYPSDSIRNEDLDSIITLFDRSTDLSGYTTYALSDELVPITPDTSDIDFPEDILNPDPDVLEFILDKIEANMDELGYQRVADPENADLLVGGGYVVVDNTVVGSYPCGGGWWWCDPYWCYPGGGWGYPGYGWYYPWDCIYSYSYEVGTILITMFDGRNIDEDLEALPVTWLGVLRGIAGTSDALSRADFAIDQAFDQSPILNPSSN